MENDMTVITHTRHGTVAGTGIVLHTPLGLPEGTEMVVDVRIAPSRGGDGVHEDQDEVHTSLTAEQIRAWALAHPAPQSWWDETDNPFEPEQVQDSSPAADERAKAR